jgi:hypothetical protein
MRAGGHYSDFKLVQRMRNAKRSSRPCPSITALEGGGAKAPYSYCIQYEIWNFLRKNLKSHAGGDDKLRIRFASPKIQTCTSTCHTVLLMGVFSPPSPYFINFVLWGCCLQSSLVPSPSHWRSACNHSIMQCRTHFSVRINLGIVGQWTAREKGKQHTQSLTRHTKHTNRIWLGPVVSAQTHS